MLDIGEKTREAAAAVIGSLDSDGRLVSSIEEVAEISACTVEAAEKARQIVMNLDPVGCGAIDVKECLLVQLAEHGEGESLATELVRDHLEDLQPHRLQHLARDTGYDVHVLDKEIGKIRVLDPYPGRRYSSEEPIYVSPEVYIEKVDDEYLVYFVDDGSPRLRISPRIISCWTKRIRQKRQRTS